MDKKKVLLIIINIILLVILIFLSYLLFFKYILKGNFEKSALEFSNKNNKIIFQIDKIVMFSNCDSVNKSALASNFTIENLYQYTDIALYINSPLKEKNMENTLKKVSIANVNFSMLPSLGDPKLYFKSINNFAKGEIINENLIGNSLDFNITSNDEANLDLPVLYNNLANPITLSYVNSNVKSDYTFTDTSTPITYDGSLLKRCNVLLEDIASKFSFDILITNNLNEEFKCTIFIDIPLKDDNISIYDGNITLKKDTNFIFYRYK